MSLNPQVRRLIIALQYICDSQHDPDMLASAMKNATAVLGNTVCIDFNPEIDTVDESGYFWKEGSSAWVCDYYKDGIWQPDLEAVLVDFDILSEEESEQS